MKILVLSGSPKKEKSDTLRITRAFLDGLGMEGDSEPDITLVHAVEKRVEYCTGCFACMYGGGTCVHDDDMAEILEKIRESDLLIWSFPLYCCGMPAPLKALLDRTLPLSSMRMRKSGDRYMHEHSQADLSKLRVVMICGCGFPNAKHNFEPAEAQFRLCFPGDPLILTVPECPMFGAPEAEIVTKPRLEAVREAGRQFARLGAVDEALIAEIGSPMIPEEQYAAIVNGQYAAIVNA